MIWERLRLRKFSKARLCEMAKSDNPIIYDYANALLGRALDPIPISVRLPPGGWSVYAGAPDPPPVAPTVAPSAVQSIRDEIEQHIDDNGVCPGVLFVSSETFEACERELVGAGTLRSLMIMGVSIVTITDQGVAV